jgi:hypothetical protein
MNENWHIWYEIYEDGVLVPHSKSKYHRSYKHKSSAERRARQMWGENSSNPITGATYSRKWIISQTCPWEDVYIFKTVTEAENFINYMFLVGRYYGWVSRADIKKYLGLDYNWLDEKQGWTVGHIADVQAFRRGGSTFVVELPQAKVID